MQIGDEQCMVVISIIRLKEDFIIVTRRRYDPKRKLHPNCRYVCMYVAVVIY